MHSPQKAIGILGGTFDPIHLGHLRMALELREALDLLNVRLIPVHQPVHRMQPIAPASVRFAMIQCAIQHEPTLIADEREILREGPSYTIDSLRELRRESPSTPLCLLVGIDAFLSFPSWNSYQEILAISHIVIAYRPQFHLPESGIVADLIKERLQHEIAYVHENLAGGILLRPITALDISASEIRKQIAMRRNPRYLLPDGVYDYIQQNGVYLNEI